MSLHWESTGGAAGGGGTDPALVVWFITICAGVVLGVTALGITGACVWSAWQCGQRMRRGWKGPVAPTRATETEQVLDRALDRTGIRLGERVPAELAEPLPSALYHHLEDEDQARRLEEWERRFGR